MRHIILMLFLIPIMLISQDKGQVYPIHTVLNHEKTYLPEPMFFDLVRPLGAKKGEFEVNSLAYFPIKRQSRNISWAPELEFTVRDGLAVEFEFPMHNNHLEAFKFAIQGTINQESKSNYVHGWQWISEYIINERIKEFTLIYLGGFHLNNDFSLFFMSGPRYVHHFKSKEGITPKPEFQALFNINFNKRISPHTTIALEQNYGRHFNIGHEYRIIPQVHYRMSHKFMMQVGLGYEWYLNSSHLALASRFIVEL